MIAYHRTTGSSAGHGLLRRWRYPLVRWILASVVGHTTARIATSLGTRGHAVGTTSSCLTCGWRRWSGGVGARRILRAWRIVPWWILLWLLRWISLSTGTLARSAHLVTAVHVRWHRITSSSRALRWWWRRGHVVHTLVGRRSRRWRLLRRIARRRGRIRCLLLLRLLLLGRTSWHSRMRWHRRWTSCPNRRLLHGPTAA